MAVQDYSINHEKVKLRYRERYLTDGVNEKSLALSRGCFRGYLPNKSTVADDRIWLTVDPLALGLDEDSFAIFANRNDGAPNYDGWAVSIRETSDIPLALGPSLLPISAGVYYLYVYILAVYQTGAVTTAAYNVSDEDPSNSGSSNYDPNAILIGRVPVTPTDTTITFDITTPAVYADVVAARKLPVPTSAQSETSLVVGDDRWGQFDSVSRWRTPTENEKLAMSNSTAPSATNPFLTIGGGTMNGPLVVDLSAYGSPATAIKGIAQGNGYGIHGVGDLGLGGYFEGGDATPASSVAGFTGLEGVGGVGDLTGSGGSGGVFGGGAGGATGYPGRGIVSRAYGAAAAGTARGEGIVAIGSGIVGTGGLFTGGDGSINAATGVEGRGGAATAGVGGYGSKGIGGVGGGGGAGGIGGDFQGGNGNVAGAGGIGCVIAGGDGGTSGAGGNGLLVTAGEGPTVAGVGMEVTGGRPTTSGNGNVAINAVGGAGLVSGTGASGAVLTGGAGVADAGGTGAYGWGGAAGTDSDGGNGGFFQGAAGDGVGAGGRGLYGRGGAGGTTGDGGYGGLFLGGAATGGVGGVGVRALGHGVSAGVEAIGGSSGIGIVAEGGGNQAGGILTGGSSSGAGLIAYAGGTTSGIGVYGLGSGRSIVGLTIATGAGLYGMGSLIGDRAGVVGYGGPDDGHGVIGTSLGEGYGVLGLGVGAVDPGTASFDGAGLVGIGSTTEDGDGIVGVGDGDGIGCYCAGGATGPALFMSLRASDPTGVTTAGAYYTDTSGYLKGYFGTAYRFVGCQGWVHARTNIVSPFTPFADGSLGIASLSYQSTPSRIRVNFDENFSDEYYVTNVTVVGSSTEYGIVHNQNVAYVDVMISDETGSVIDLSANVRRINITCFGN